MQALLTKNGFSYCGIIHLENGRSSESHPSLLEDGRVATDEDEVNGDPRLAFQKSLIT